MGFGKAKWLARGKYRFPRFDSRPGTPWGDSSLSESDEDNRDVLCIVVRYIDQKENEIFLIYKEIQMGSVARSYMRKSFLTFEEIRKYFFK
jgi:hypothetical protein